MSERVIRGLAPEARYVQKAKQIGDALIEEDGNILIGKDLEVDGKMTINSASDIITKDGSAIGGDIETINGTITGDTAVTLEKAITKVPVLLHLQTEEEMVHYDFLVFSGISLGDTSYYSSLATMNFGQIEESSKLDIVTIEVNGGTTAVILQGFMLQEPSNIDSGAKLVPTIRKNAQDETIVEWYPFMTEPLKDGCVLASKLSEKNKTEWQSLKTVGGQSLLGTGDIPTGGMETINATFTDNGDVTLAKAPINDCFIIKADEENISFVCNRIGENSYVGGYYMVNETSVSFITVNFADMTKSLVGTGMFANYELQTSYQKKTFLHSLTAKGATLSMSFTYPSTNKLPVDSPQDATAVIKPTSNEYFASPVVVVATKKLSDSYNCIYYNGTLWKFALWDGTSFTDGEAVTDWKDSVVAVD